MQCAKRKRAISVDFQRTLTISFNNQGKILFFFFRQTKIESFTINRSSGKSKRFTEENLKDSLQGKKF